MIMTLYRILTIQSYLIQCPSSSTLGNWTYILGRAKIIKIVIFFNSKVFVHLLPSMSFCLRYERNKWLFLFRQTDNIRLSFPFTSATVGLKSSPGVRVGQGRIYTTGWGGWGQNYYTHGPLKQIIEISKLWKRLDNFSHFPLLVFFFPFPLFKVWGGAVGP